MSKCLKNANKMCFSHKKWSFISRIGLVVPEIWQKLVDEAGKKSSLVAIMGIVNSSDET